MNKILCVILTPIFLGLAFLHTGFAQKPSNWDYSGEKDGIKIYHQKTPGFLHIKLSTTVRVPLSGIFALFTDVDHYKDWGYKISESRLLKRISSNEVWLYMKYDFPWPLEDRDIILKSRMEQDPVSRQIHITNTPYPTFLPENKGITRIKNTTTEWIFIPGPDNWVYFEQYIHTDSAEDLPDWVVKIGVDTGPRETAKNVRRLLQQEKYQTIEVVNIKN